MKKDNGRIGEAPKAPKITYNIHINNYIYICHDDGKYAMVASTTKQL